MSVFPLPVNFTENKTDESPNYTGKAKSYPDDGGIRHFLFPVYTWISSLSHFHLEDTLQTILKISTLLRIHYHINSEAGAETGVN